MKKYWFEMFYIFILVLIIGDHGGYCMSDLSLSVFAIFLVVMFIADLFCTK